MSGTSAWPSIPRPACARRPMGGRSSCQPPPERPLENPQRPTSDSGASVDIAFLVFPTPRPCFRFRRRVYGSLPTTPHWQSLGAAPPPQGSSGWPHGSDASWARSAATPGTHLNATTTVQAAAAPFTLPPPTAPAILQTSDPIWIRYRYR